MTREEFQRYFRVGQVVPSGGSRSNLKIDRISDNWVSVIPVAAKRQQPKRLHFSQLSAVVDGFSEIDPKRIEPTIQPVLTSRGLKKENTTENYLYGFARAYLIGAQLEANLITEEISEPTLYTEGAKKTIVVSAYERDLNARVKCLSHHGTRCCVCQIDLGKIYGDIGVGFVHVHHLNPIAARGGEYKLDAIKDLRPVCPNCHSMLHRTDPILSPRELRVRIFERKNSDVANVC